MVATVENIKATDPNEQALDGTVGGKLDQMNPESVENTDGGGVKVTPRADDLINRAIEKATLDIIKLEAERKSINDQISAIIEDIESEGVSRYSFRYNLRVYKMSPEQREGLDLGYILCRKATGNPMQTDWIDETEGEQSCA